MNLRDHQAYLALVVPKPLVKQIKDALETHGRLDKRTKIKEFHEGLDVSLMDGDSGNIKDGNCCIPITVRSNNGDSLLEFIHLTRMQEHKNELSLVNIFSHDAVSDKDTSCQTNSLARAIKQWLQQRPHTAHNGHGQSMSDMEARIDSRNWTYTVYPPLLLVSPAVFVNLLSIIKKSGGVNDVASLYHFICTKLEVNRIAINAPIPNSMMIAPSEHCDRKNSTYPESDARSTPNILRSPTGLTPLYGDFGQILPSEHVPTAEDFGSAFWCTARQNDIFQTWAPRYTMFSRGNISEKARLLQLGSLRHEKLRTEPRGTSAVDLYAGIGYFAFSYAKASVRKVLCWEINPWSVEGLRRGAEGNGWNVGVFQGEESYEYLLKEDSRFLVFQESNEHAVARVNAMRGKVPPVKHVNCGYLPSSKDSWEIAVQVLDSTGGWIHAHENIAKKDVDARKADVVTIFGELLKKYRNQMWKVRCDHVHHVKRYAPGIIHCVLDISLFPQDL